MPIPPLLELQEADPPNLDGLCFDAVRVEFHVVVCGDDGSRELHAAFDTEGEAHGELYRLNNAEDQPLDHEIDVALYRRRRDGLWEWVCNFWQAEDAYRVMAAMQVALSVARGRVTHYTQAQALWAVCEDHENLQARPGPAQHYQEEDEC